MNILMVCLGNICRSPMAHGLLEYKIKKEGLNWKVDSAGTSAYHQGEPPDSRAISCMKLHGISIQHQQSRPFTVEDFERFDLIFCMDKSNLRNVLALAINNIQAAKVKLLLHEIPDELEEEVPDPYYGGIDGFESVYKLLDCATDWIIQNYSNMNHHV